MNNNNNNNNNYYYYYCYYIIIDLHKEFSTKSSVFIGDSRLFDLRLGVSLSNILLRYNMMI